jgi:ubiquinone/menaquinone biosynthesis C-methylase UbiE
MIHQRHQIDEFWKQQALRFDEQYARQDASPLAVIVSAFLNERYRKIAPLLQARAGQRCLDVGCGSGYYAALLAQMGARTTALDYSAQMLELAQARLAGEGALVRGDAARIPFVDAQFDFIIAVGLFDYVPEPANVLREFHRVLQLAGQVVITFPKSPSPVFFLRTRIGVWLRRVFLHLPPILNTLTRDQLAAFFSVNGFTLTHIDQVQQTMWIAQAAKNSTTPANVE